MMGFANNYNEDNRGGQDGVWQGGFSVSALLTTGQSKGPLRKLKRHGGDGHGPPAQIIINNLILSLIFSHLLHFFTWYR